MQAIADIAHAAMTDDPEAFEAMIASAQENLDKMAEGKRQEFEEARNLFEELEARNRLVYSKGDGVLGPERTRLRDALEGDNE